MKLSIVIVNFNGQKHLRDCLVSLYEKISIAFEVIVVDNDSQDGSVNLIKNEFPEVLLVCNQKNYGFAKGNNIGAESACGEYILLLNNDTVLLDDLADAVNLLDSHQRIGILGAKMLAPDQSYRKSAGYFPLAHRLFRFSHLHRDDDGFHDGSFPDGRRDFIRVDWVEGSFLLVRKSLWTQLGGLDETYFMYVEDVDFCYSVCQQGYQTVYYPVVKYIHVGGFGVARFKLLLAGFLKFHRKHSNVLMLGMVRFILFTGVLCRFVYFRFFSNKVIDKEKADACLDAIRSVEWFK